ncbi:MAG: AraC family transcriptional regulator [Deltaproteobacteria bacterium]|nr:AraC family transcriptional regulator [Deltaproteobacteria bacterium]
MGAWVHDLAVGATRWTLATPALPSHLQPYVRSWMGYSERSPGPTRRRELPGAAVVLIIEFGPALRLSNSGQESCQRRRRPGFVAGLDTSFTFTEHDGFQEGLQVNLTPLGARLVLGPGIPELSGHTASLSELTPELGNLDDRLALADWPERFSVVAQLLTARIGGRASVPGTVDWALHEIETRGGQVRIERLATDLGLSRRRLGQLFEAQVGLPPKLYAELVRFERLTQAIKDNAGPWSQLAAELGFADQAHLSREVRRFSGLTPTALRTLVGGFPGTDG